MRVTVLSHSLSSNASLRAYRVTQALRTFVDAELLGPAKDQGRWPALPDEPWIRSVRYKRFPRFFETFERLVEAAGSDVLLAVKPHLASFGAALVAGERRGVPVVLDIDDVDEALRPRATWDERPEDVDLSQPRSAVYVALFTKARSAAAARTVASSALQRRYGGELLPQAADLATLDPDRVDREAARRRFGFARPTVVFAGTPHRHKGVDVLIEAMRRLPEVDLAITLREREREDGQFDRPGFLPLPLMPMSEMPELLAAADVVAAPQLDDEIARHQMPMKIFDAMAMAKPIVASAVSDLPAVLDGCGRLVPPGDVDRLAAAIGGLVESPSDAVEMGRAARERCAAEYSLERMAERLAGLLERLEI